LCSAFNIDLFSDIGGIFSGDSVTQTSYVALDELDLVKIHRNRGAQIALPERMISEEDGFTEHKNANIVVYFKFLIES
jgi:hypothetical protein